MGEDQLEQLCNEWEIETALRTVGRHHYPDLDGETVKALGVLQRSGIDIYSQLGFDGQTLVVHEPVLESDLVSLGADFAGRMNVRSLLKHNIYRVPLLFHPETLLDRDSFSPLDEFLKKLRPRPKTRILSGKPDDDTAGQAWDRKWRKKWTDDHREKLMRFKPRQWLERQMFDVLLFTLDIICSSLFWRYWRAMSNDRRVPKNVDMCSEIPISYERFDCDKLPRPTTPDGERKARIYETARLVLIDLGVIRVNPSYEVGERCMGYNLKSLYRRPIFKFVGIERPRARCKPKPEVPEGDIEQFVQRNLQKLEVDTGAWGEMVKSEASNPERLTLCVDAWRRLETDVKVKRGEKSARLHHPLTYCPKEFRKTLRLDGEVLVDIDIATAQATLFYAHLREIGADAEEIEIYRQLLEDHEPGSPHDDIYKKLYTRRKTIPLTDSERDRSKMQFYIYIYSGEWRTSRVANRMRKLMPKICRRVIEAGDASAADLQNMEAEVIIDGAVAHCMRSSTFIVPIHDGIICRPRDHKKLRGWIERRLKKATGLRNPRVTVEDLKIT